MIRSYRQNLHFSDCAMRAFSAGIQGKSLTGVLGTEFPTVYVVIIMKRKSSLFIPFTALIVEEKIEFGKNK